MIAGRTPFRAVEGHCGGLLPGGWNLLGWARKHNSLMGNKAGMCKKTGELEKCDEGRITGPALMMQGRPFVAVRAALGLAAGLHA